MSERINVVLVPTPRTPESSLEVKLEIDKEPKEPWEMALDAAFVDTLQDVERLLSVMRNQLFGPTPATNLPPAPTALVHINSALASLARTIASVITSQIPVMEKVQEKDEAARIVLRVLRKSVLMYAAFAKVIAEFTSTVVHGLVPAHESNTLAMGILTGMAPFKAGGEVAVGQPQQTTPVKR